MFPHPIGDSYAQNGVNMYLSLQISAREGRKKDDQALHKVGPSKPAFTGSINAVYKAKIN
jgi:hypothetical protein